VETVEHGLVSGFAIIESTVVFFLITLGVGLFVTLNSRARLKKVARPGGWLLIVLALVLCVVLPAVGGVAGCTYRGQAAAAETMEKIDPGKHLVKLVELGGKELRARLELPADDKTVLSLEQVRTVAAERRKAASGGINGRLEAMWWQMVEAAIEGRSDKLTYGDLIAQTEKKLHAKIREVFHDYAGDLRKSARMTLFGFLGLAALANGLAIFFARRAAGQPR
jgi:hypothetical protein